MNELFFSRDLQTFGNDLGLDLTGLPRVGEAVPQALAVTPEQPAEDAVEEAVQVEALQLLLPPDPLQRQVHVVPHDVQHLRDRNGPRKVFRLRSDVQANLTHIRFLFQI